jgi:hypothetical protein
MAAVIIGVPLIFNAIETKKMLIVTGIIKRLERTTKRLKNIKTPTAI